MLYLWGSCTLCSIHVSRARLGVAVIRRCGWVNLADVLQAAALVQDLGKEYGDLPLRPEACSVEALFEALVHLLRGDMEPSRDDCFVKQISAGEQRCGVCLHSRVVWLDEQGAAFNH